MQTYQYSKVWRPGVYSYLVKKGSGLSRKMDKKKYFKISLRTIEF